MPPKSDRPPPGYALEHALHYAELGYAVLPIKEGRKYPPFPWKKYQTQVPNRTDLRYWFAKTRYGVALVCGELITIDVDCSNEVDFAITHAVQKNSKHKPPICTTPRGGYHLHTRARAGVSVSNRIRIKGRRIDLRTHGGLAIVPPTPGYVWRDAVQMLPLRDLPPFTVTWTREQTKRKVQAFLLSEDADEKIRRARAYVAKIEGAVSGQGGHNRTMRVAGVLVQKFGLTVESALPLFQVWNEKCEPAWTDTELLHKLHAAEQNKGVYLTN